jgi:hypothetical protein
LNAEANRIETSEDKRVPSDSWLVQIRDNSNEELCALFVYKMMRANYQKLHLDDQSVIQESDVKISKILSFMLQDQQFAMNLFRNILLRSIQTITAIQSIKSEKARELNSKNLVKNIQIDNIIDPLTFNFFLEKYMQMGSSDVFQWDKRIFIDFFNSSIALAYSFISDRKLNIRSSLDLLRSNMNMI